MCSKDCAKRLLFLFNFILWVRLMFGLNTFKRYLNMLAKNKIFMHIPIIHDILQSFSCNTLTSHCSPACCSCSTLINSVSKYHVLHLLSNSLLIFSNTPIILSVILCPVSQPSTLFPYVYHNLAQRDPFSVMVCLCVQLGGAFLLAIGVWVKVDPTMVMYLHVVNVSPSDPLLQYAACVFMVAGGLSFFVGIVGCCGAMREHQGLLFLVRNIDLASCMITIFDCKI